MRIRKHAFAILLATLLVASGCGSPDEPAGPDLLPTIGARATEGAAPGYVADEVCGTCHADKYQSYQHVGMAQSLRKPGHQAPMESFGEEFYDATLQRYYQFVERDDNLVFRRYQRDRDGEEINLLELPVAWVMGSGNRARSYLYQTGWGEMFLLPVGWYSEEGKWEMSPGFEHANHPGINRAVPRKCMFCHNAFPEVAAGSDAPWVEETFPETLPEGTGCQRCHGPGADHIRSALAGNEIAVTRGKIVNPANLTPELRDSVCFQCHMLPSASLTGAHRFGRGIYSFRPGQQLSDYLVHADPVEFGENRADRFEINHHGYRFVQSQCYLQSEGELSCISCHDPHVKPDSSTFRRQVGEVCSDCHADPGALHAADTGWANGDCVTCHMPRTRTGDVVHVTMTDHRIATGPFNFEALVAPREKENRVITDIELLDLGDIPTGLEADAYTALAAIRSGRNVTSASLELEGILKSISLPDNEAYVDLATSQFGSGRYREAEMTARELIESGEHLRTAYSVLGTSQLAQGRPGEAIESLQQSLSHGEHPETHFNLAAAYLARNSYEIAEQHIDEAIRLRPTMANAWKYKARLLKARNADEQARDAYMRALALQPLDLPLYGELVDLLRSVGQPDDADRYLELGLRMSRMIADLEAGN